MSTTEPDNISLPETPDTNIGAGKMHRCVGRTREETGQVWL